MPEEERKIEIDGKEYTWNQYKKRQKWFTGFDCVMSFCCGIIGGHGIVQGFITGNPYYFILVIPLALWLIRLQRNMLKSRKKIRELEKKLGLR